MSNGNSRRVPTSISLSDMEMSFIKELDPDGLTHYIRKKIMEDMGRTQGRLSKEFEAKYARHTSALASAVLLIAIGVAFALIGYLLFLVLLTSYMLILFVVGVAFCYYGAFMAYKYKKMVSISITVERQTEENKQWRSSLR